MTELDEEDVATDDAEASYVRLLYTTAGHQLSDMVNYIYTCKKIPSDLEQEYIHVNIRSFEPAETSCANCNGEPSERNLITNDTKIPCVNDIVGDNRMHMKQCHMWQDIWLPRIHIVGDVRMHMKQCVTCGRTYGYQEFTLLVTSECTWSSVSHVAGHMATKISHCWWRPNEHEAVSHVAGHMATKNSHCWWRPNAHEAVSQVAGHMATKNSHCWWRPKAHEAVSHVAGHMATMNSQMYTRDPTPCFHTFLSWYTSEKIDDNTSRNVIPPHDGCHKSLCFMLHVLIKAATFFWVRCGFFPPILFGDLRHNAASDLKVKGLFKWGILQHVWLFRWGISMLVKRLSDLEQEYIHVDIRSKIVIRTSCVNCNGEPSERNLITDGTKILCVNNIIGGVQMHMKQCVTCGSRTYHYQEFTEVRRGTTPCSHTHLSLIYLRRNWWQQIKKCHSPIWWMS